MNIQGVSLYTGVSSCGGGSIDPEQKRIAQKLLSYGYTPTGNKSTDKATLRKIELRKAKESNTIRNDLLTVSYKEQEEIQLKKRELRKDLNPQINNDKFDGAKAMGEQIYLAIKMKKNKKQ